MALKANICCTFVFYCNLPIQTIVSCDQQSAKHAYFKLVQKDCEQINITNLYLNKVQAI